MARARTGRQATRSRSRRCTGSRPCAAGSTRCTPRSNLLRSSRCRTAARRLRPGHTGRTPLRSRHVGIRARRGAASRPARSDRCTSSAGCTRPWPDRRGVTLTARRAPGTPSVRVVRGRQEQPHALHPAQRRSWVSSTRSIHPGAKPPDSPYRARGKLLGVAYCPVSVKYVCIYVMCCQGGKRRCTRKKVRVHFADRGLRRCWLSSFIAAGCRM